MTTETKTPAVIDYEGSPYQTAFWVKGRAYEDRVERVALRRLLPDSGSCLLELGAGFGRLTEEYAGYEKVIVLDYSRSLLEEAQENLGKDERYIYVAANIYKLPIANGLCDTATMIRVLHHFADVPAAFQQIRQALSPDATFILEFANKRNLKAIVRYLLRLQKWNPFSEEPVEFVRLNFDFHPHYIQRALADNGFHTDRKLAVSYLRAGILKRLLPVSVLSGIDGVLQHTGAVVNLSPSVFTRNRVTAGGSAEPAPPDTLFKCPKCQSMDLQPGEDTLVCGGCQSVWSTAGGIYDFRKPVK